MQRSLSKKLWKKSINFRKFPKKKQFWKLVVGYWYNKKLLLVFQNYGQLVQDNFENGKTDFLPFSKQEEENYKDVWCFWYKLV